MDNLQPHDIFYHSSNLHDRMAGVVIVEGITGDDTLNSLLGYPASLQADDKLRFWLVYKHIVDAHGNLLREFRKDPRLHAVTHQLGAAIVELTVLFGLYEMKEEPDEWGLCKKGTFWDGFDAWDEDLHVTGRSAAGEARAYLRNQKGHKDLEPEA